MTEKRLAVDLLQTFRKARNQPLTTRAVMDASGWSAGPLYSALLALEACGMLESKWEDRFATLPRHRVYEMTEAGRTFAAAALTPKEAE